MYDFTDSPLVRNDKTLVLAHDHGLEHGPKQFAGVEERLDPREASLGRAPAPGPILPVTPFESAAALRWLTRTKRVQTG